MSSGERLSVGGSDSPRLKVSRKVVPTLLAGQRCSPLIWRVEHAVLDTRIERLASSGVGLHPVFYRLLAAPCARSALLRGGWVGGRECSWDVRRRGPLAAGVHWEPLLRAGGRHVCDHFLRRAGASPATRLLGWRICRDLVQSMAVCDAAGDGERRAAASGHATGFISRVHPTGREGAGRGLVASAALPVSATCPSHS